jgi:hypothetical protein
MYFEENAIGNARHAAAGEGASLNGAECFQCLAHRQDGLTGKQFTVHKHRQSRHAPERSNWRHDAE